MLTPVRSPCWILQSAHSIETPAQDPQLPMDRESNTRDFLIDVFCQFIVPTTPTSKRIVNSKLSDGVLQSGNVTRFFVCPGKNVVIDISCIKLVYFYHSAINVVSVCEW